MKITIENTSKVVQVDGVPARIWEGKTETGIAVHAFITRISPQTLDPRQLDIFEQEFKQVSPPSAEVAAYPLRMIL